MKRRILSLLLAFVLVFMIASIGFALETRASYGGCSVHYSGFSGTTSSDELEARISVSVTLKRLVGNDWEYVDSCSESNQSSSGASASKTRSLEGGYYYKAFATHYTTSRGSWASESNMLWVP